MSATTQEAPQPPAEFAEVLGQMSSQASAEPEISLAIHAANRLMFGPRQGDTARIEQIGYEAFLEEQLNPNQIDDSAALGIAATFPNDSLFEDWTTAWDRRSQGSSVYRAPVEQVKHACWNLMVNSKRQLYEHMVEFWFNHFNIYAYQSSIVQTLWAKWNETIRSHAMGNFRGLLEATARHPCMLYYLDNYRNTSGGPNENYARELMELHSLGAMNYQQPGGYIDQDVYEISRCFTGWTYEGDSDEPLRGQFKYNHEQHDRFIKVVFGQQIPGDQPPLKDGLDILDRIAYHMGTARHIAWKLARRFISDNPPDSIVNSTAQVFFDTRYAPDQIRQTLRHLLLSEEFRNSRMTKFKRPVEWVTSAMRALKVNYSSDSTFEWLYDGMGMPMFEWRTPDGPPEDWGHWASSNNLLKRWNWAFRVLSGWHEGDLITSQLATEVPDWATTPRHIGGWMIAKILARPVSQLTLDCILNFVADGRSLDLPIPLDQREDKIPQAAALCVMTPEFMRR